MGSSLRRQEREREEGREEKRGRGRGPSDCLLHVDIGGADQARDSKEG